MPRTPRLIAIATPAIVFAALFALLGGVNSASDHRPSGVAAAELRPAH